MTIQVVYVQKIPKQSKIAVANDTESGASIESPKM